MTPHQMELVGLENVWCKKHNRPLAYVADSFSFSVWANGDKPVIDHHKYRVCAMMFELPIYTRIYHDPCDFIFKPKGEQDANWRRQNKTRAQEERPAAGCSVFGFWKRLRRRKGKKSLSKKYD